MLWLCQNYLLQGITVYIYSYCNSIRCFLYYNSVLVRVYSELIVTIFIVVLVLSEITPANTKIMEKLRIKYFSLYTNITIYQFNCTIRVIFSLNEMNKVSHLIHTYTVLMKYMQILDMGSNTSISSGQILRVYHFTEYKFQLPQLIIMILYI